MLIVFEGIDGCGKSSVIDAVKLRLADLGVECEVTSEFGRAEDWSVDARAKLMASRNAQEELHHVMDTRVTHQERILGPLLALNHIVLMDRFLMSTMAYQSSLTISEDFLLQRHIGLELPVPDLTFLIDIASETAKQRTSYRQDQSKIDQRPIAFFDEARGRYRRASSKLLSIGWDIQILNGEAPLAMIAESVAKRVMAKIKATAGVAA